MIVEKNGNISVLSQEKGSVKDFLRKLMENYSHLQRDNLVLHLFSIDAIPPSSLAEFLVLSKQHKINNKSFVIVYNKLSYDGVPGNLVVVPTVQEALDIIEMDEIERDLGI